MPPYLSRCWIYAYHSGAAISKCLDLRFMAFHGSWFERLSFSMSRSISGCSRICLVSPFQFCLLTFFRSVWTQQLFGWFRGLWCRSWYLPFRRPFSALASVTISAAAWLLCSTAVSFVVTISVVAWLLSATTFSFVGCVAAVPVPLL